MFQINKNSKPLYISAILGLCGACMVYFHFFGCFAILPILFVGITFDIIACSVCVVSFLVSILLCSAPSVVIEAFFNTALPSYLFCFMARRNVRSGEKIWWYPEQKLLENNTIIAMISIAILSLFCFSEKDIKSVLTLMADSLPQHNMDKAELLSYSNIIVGMSMVIFMYLNIIMFALALKLREKFKNYSDSTRALVESNYEYRDNFCFDNIKSSKLFSVAPLIFFALASIFPKFSFVFGGVGVVSLFTPIISGAFILSSLAHSQIKFPKRYTNILTFILFVIWPLSAFIAILDSFVNIRSFLKQK